MLDQTLRYFSRMYESLTYYLYEKLGGFQLAGNRWQFETELIHHKLLHYRKVLFTEPGLLHHHDALKAGLAQRGRQDWNITMEKQMSYRETLQYYISVVQPYTTLAI